MSSYQAVLDVYALVATYPDEARVLRETTQAVALAYLRGHATGSELRLLVRLACDLAYVDEELAELHCTFITDASD